jgi:ribonuclease J
MLPDSEIDLEDEFTHIFRSTVGLALVQTSGQNIDRLVTIYRACLKTGRELVVDLYTAMILEATRNPKIPQSHWNRMALCIPSRQRIQIKKSGWFEALGRHSSRRLYLNRDIAKDPGKYLLIFCGLWMGDLDRAGCLDGACLIHSQWEGYLRETRFKEIDVWRKRHNIRFHQVHNREVCKVPVLNNDEPLDTELSDLHFLVQYLVTRYQRAQQLYDDQQLI